MPQERSLFIATPMYAGQCYGEFSSARENLVRPLAELGIPARARAVGDSLVTRARDALAAEFMHDTATDLLFIDADIVFEPQDVLDLLGHPDKDVVCGAYSKKEINWAMVRDAAKLGFADEDPTVLEQFVGTYFFHPVYPERSHRMTDPMEVTEAGTGFMLIRRHVLEAFMATYPERAYHPADGAPRYGHKIGCFFDTAIVGDRLLAEDQNFCRLVRQMGMKVWVLPHIHLTHLGYYRFIGNMSALGAIQNAKESPRAKG